MVVAGMRERKYDVRDSNKSGQHMMALTICAPESYSLVT